MRDVYGLFFFFQAEDGIRDGHVTGVQTCALPISACHLSDAPLKWQAGQFLHYSLPHPDADDRGITRYFTIASAPFEIGRASCRERGAVRDARGALQTAEERKL